MSTEKQTHGFQAEVSRLLHLMIHSLYSNREIFLRELVSNASDACDKLRFQSLDNPALIGEGAEPAITLTIDKEAGTLTVADNGIGMDESRDYDGQSCWKINVLAGESNYRSGYPGFLIVVTFFVKDRIEAAALLDPITGDEWTSMRGRGVQLNERRVRVDASTLDLALAAIDSSDPAEIGRWSERVAGIRVSGCGLMNIAQLVAGRVQLAFADDLNDVDFPAASLLLQEAGALSGDRNGGPVSARKGELLAASPRLFKQLFSRG